MRGGSPAGVGGHLCWMICSQMSPDAWTEDPAIRGCSQGRQVETGAAQEAAALRGLGTVAFRMAGE